jgi:hypothetical protein
VRERRPTVAAGSIDVVAVFCESAVMMYLFVVSV